MAKDHPDFSRSRRYRGAKNTSLSSASPTAGAAGEQDGPRTSADVRRADQQSHAHTPRRVGSDSTGAEDSDLQERIGERRKSRRAARHSAASEDEEGGNRRSRTKRSAAAETRKKSDRRPPTSRQVSISPERNGYEPERDPGHGKGSAAVQGDAIRRQTERERAVPLGGGRSARHSRHSSPTGGGRHTSRRQQDHREREREHEHDRDRPRTPFANEEAPLPGSAAAQGDAIRRGEKPTRPSVAYANKGREKTYHAPAGEQNAPAIPRVYPMTGIDNLALLMEDKSYHPACFSIYMFKTVLDIETVDEFFRVLAEAYPKYRYLVELDPSAATKKEDARKKAKKEAMKNGISEKPSGPGGRRQTKFDPGRKTRYAKGLKAGGMFRPARWRLDEDFDVSENIEEAECPGDGDEGSLFRLAGQFLARHFDYSKPVWEALLVKGVDTEAGAKSALMIKIHHCFSDGQGMIQSYHAALAAMASSSPIKSIQQKIDAASDVKKPGQRNVKPGVLGTIKHTAHTVRGLYFRSRKSFQYSGGDEPRAEGRLYCHSEGIKMSDIKLIREAFSTSKMSLSLNDVACAILSRSLRIAAERTSSEKVKDKRVAVFVPISVRPKGDWDLYNYTTGAIAWFRFHDPKNTSFEEQLEQVNREMNRVKSSWVPKIWYKTFDMVCKHRIMYMPNYPLARSFFYRAFKEYHVATNVPGPPKAVKFGEHEAYGYHVLPPSSPGKATMAIGMISYAGDFSLAVSCDDVPEFKRLPAEICDAFQDASLELVDAARRKLGRA